MSNHESMLIDSKLLTKELDLKQYCIFMGGL